MLLKELNSIGKTFTVNDDALATKIDDIITNNSNSINVIDNYQIGGINSKVVSDATTPITPYPPIEILGTNYADISPIVASNNTTTQNITNFANQQNNDNFATIKDCDFTDVMVVVRYIKKEMETNSSSSICNMIKSLNDKFWTATMPFVLYKLEAYITWKEMVGKDKPWDHKQIIRETIHNNQNWSCCKGSIKGKFLKFNFDIWSNVHYGYVGKSAGFTEFELLNGAGYAQIGDNNKPLDRWETWKEYIKNRTVDIGDADILGGFDDPCDQQAIKVGFRLYDKKKYSFISEHDIIEELYSVYASGKPINIKTCENHN